jgi:hypothetical protein
VRYLVVSINHDPTTGQQELLNEVEEIVSDADIPTMLYERYGWVDGLGDAPPTGRIEQMPEGHWTFPGEDHLRMYVQVDQP